jgi:hypothetical protein
MRASLGLVVLAIACVGAQATAQPADLSQDPLLQRRITVWLKMEPLRDALRTIGKQTGVALRCQDAIAEEKVAIFVRERPAHEILTQLAGALRYAWRKDEDAYVLYVPDETRQAEEQLRRELADLRRQAIRDWIQAVREALQMPPRAATPTQGAVPSEFPAPHAPARGFPRGGTGFSAPPRAHLRRRRRT